MATEFRVMIQHYQFGWVELEDGLTELEAIKLRDETVEQHCDRPDQARVEESDEFGVYWD